MYRKPRGVAEYARVSVLAEHLPHFSTELALCFRVHGISRQVVNTEAGFGGFRHMNDRRPPLPLNDDSSQAIFSTSRYRACVETRFSWLEIKRDHDPLQNSGVSIFAESPVRESAELAFLI